MSINLTRRDALKGAMAAGAALAATPYLLNLTGGLQASPTENSPVKSAVTGATASSGSPSARADPGTTVLVIKGDTIKSFSGFQSMKVQDAVLASKLRNALVARLE